jgi:hypothetical protein
MPMPPADGLPSLAARTAIMTDRRIGGKEPGPAAGEVEPTIAARRHSASAGPETICALHGNICENNFCLALVRYATCFKGMGKG